MAKNELVYAFDLGSGSIGVCARQGENILHLDSLILDADFASVKEASARRRQIRTRLAHKAREKWWDAQAKKAGIEVLSTSQPTKDNQNLKPDKRMLTEFSPAGSDDKTIYSSHLLRIALLQGVKLEGWQVYKAIRSAMQRRGYDANLPWASDADKQNETKDEKDNAGAANVYNKKLNDIFGSKMQFHYPCYYEAYTQSIWDYNKPENLTGRLGTNPQASRNKENKPAEDKAFPSRELVEKELKALLVSAAKLFPKLKGKENFVIYGEAEQPYASYKVDKYKKYRGTERDWHGLLGQKVPRFDNRIIAKCRLIPRLNVCKANKRINEDVSFLLALKNMRYSKGNTTSMALTPEQVNEIYEVYTKYLTSEKNKDKVKPVNNPFTKTFWKNYVRNKIGGEVNAGQQEILKPKAGGRSSFCRPALYVLRSLILNGKNPHDYFKELTKDNKNADTSKGLVNDDYKFLLAMPNDWYGISIQDAREEDKQLSKEEAQIKIYKIISAVSNRIVRHRLLMLVEQFKALENKCGTPNKIIFEIAREDFLHPEGEKYKELINFQKSNKKENELAVEKLKNLGLNINAKNILKIRLGNQQDWKDVYDTTEHRELLPQEIENYEIDHIVPQGAQGGSDSFSNFVLTKESLNRKKSGLTPYEWFHKERSGDWEHYVKQVNAIYGKNKANKRKIDLLISDKAASIEKRKTDLQATAHIEKLAQKIAGLYFGFGVNTKGDKKQIEFYTGGETANVRSKLDLNRVLHYGITDDEWKKLKADPKFKEKNRKNKRHHALDALVLSVLPEIKISKREIESKPQYFDKVYAEREIAKVIPETIRQITPKLRETIYALRRRIEDGKKCYYFVSRFDSSIENFRLLEGKTKSDKCARKNVDKIFDTKIKKDFQQKLQQLNLSQSNWEEWLNEYTDNGKRIKKIAMVDSKCFAENEVFSQGGTLKEVIGEYGQNGVFGQWVKGKEGHQGQIVYKDEKSKWKVEPVYAFESLYNKQNQYKNKYKEIKFFKAGQLIKLVKSFNGIPAGVYKLRTILSVGATKLENINTQAEYSQSITNFIENCGMETYEK
jgi:CRISPR-associated endonuclease Csn1